MLSVFLSYFQFMRLLLLMLLIFLFCFHSPRFLFSHTVRMNVNSFRFANTFLSVCPFPCYLYCIVESKHQRRKKGNQNQQERLRRNIGVFVDLWIAGVFFCMYGLCVMHTGDSKREWKSFMKDILLLFLFLGFFSFFSHVGREKKVRQGKDSVWSALCLNDSNNSSKNLHQM